MILFEGYTLFGYIGAYYITIIISRYIMVFTFFFKYIYKKKILSCVRQQLQ